MDTLTSLAFVSVLNVDLDSFWPTILSNSKNYGEEADLFVFVMILSLSCIIALTLAVSHNATYWETTGSFGVSLTLGFYSG